MAGTEGYQGGQGPGHPRLFMEEEYGAYTQHLEAQLKAAETENKALARETANARRAKAGMEDELAQLEADNSHLKGELSKATQVPTEYFVAFTLIAYGVHRQAPASVL